MYRVCVISVHTVPGRVFVHNAHQYAPYHRTFDKSCCTHRILLTDGRAVYHTSNAVKSLVAVSSTLLLCEARQPTSRHPRLGALWTARHSCCPKGRCVQYSSLLGKQMSAANGHDILRHYVDAQSKRNNISTSAQRWVVPS